LKSDLPTSELVKQIKGVKGVGNYAAENLLKLLGRYDGLALDSWTRAKFFKVRNNGRKANDKRIARYYARFNEWRGLALWCDVTRDWLYEEKEAGAACRSRGSYLLLQTARAPNYLLKTIVESCGPRGLSL
jgi:hypothetical protein